MIQLFSSLFSPRIFKKEGKKEDRRITVLRDFRFPCTLVPSFFSLLLLCTKILRTAQPASIASTYFGTTKLLHCSLNSMLHIYSDWRDERNGRMFMHGKVFTTSSVLVVAVYSLWCWQLAATVAAAATTTTTTTKKGFSTEWMRARHIVMWYRDYRLVHDRDNTPPPREMLYTHEKMAPEGKKEVKKWKEEKKRKNARCASGEKIYFF